MAADTSASAPARHRPRSATVFVAAFVAGAAAAVGVNRALDVHLAQAKPQVECEPIFVALRSLPQGMPVTVWDVALRDWPKAMLPSTALRVTDSFEGCLLKVPLREGQPLLSAQLVKPEVIAPATNEQPAKGDGEEPLVEEAFVPPTPASEPVASSDPASAPTVETAAERMPEPPVEMAAVETAVVPAEPPAQPAATEPATVAAADDSTPPAVAGQPTLAAPPEQPSEPASRQPEPAVAEATPLPNRDDGDAMQRIDAAFDVGDMPSRAPADLATIPSVMSQARIAAAPPAEETGTGAGVRYLVVPERIARQADTSFTAPVAPEGRPASVREQPPAQGRTMTAPPAATPAPKNPAAPLRQRQATSRQSQTRQPPAKQQNGQQVKPTTARSQSQQQAVDGRRGEPGSRGWGEMFPNVSAGIEAMGGWRGRVREAGVPQTESARP